MATGTLKTIAVSGAAPVTMQNKTAGRPSAPPASLPASGASFVWGDALTSAIELMRPLGSGDGQTTERSIDLRAGAESGLTPGPATWPIGQSRGGRLGHSA